MILVAWVLGRTFALTQSDQGSQFYTIDDYINKIDPTNLQQMFQDSLNFKNQPQNAIRKRLEVSTLESAFLSDSLRTPRDNTQGDKHVEFEEPKELPAHPESSSQRRYEPHGLDFNFARNLNPD